MRKTAIILFAHLPDFEARAKSLSGFSSKRATRNISNVLTQHFYNLAKQTSVDTFLIDTYHQKGKSFGERITNAFKNIYAKGYQHVICIGNDCPELDLKQLNEAVNAVIAGKVVLGPTWDGGSYLIGIPKSKFNASRFKNIKWQSSATYKHLKQLFNHQVEELSLQVDIDSAESIVDYFSKNNLVKILQNLVYSYKINLSNQVIFPILEFFWVDHSSLTSPPQAS